MVYGSHVAVFGCKGCRKCISVCGENAIFYSCGRVQIDMQKCNSCGQCVSHCPNKALLLMD
ncbi:4Fe-4S binding protein [Methanohalophilus halophilus]|uniref:4Fe-4S binding domain-containing protein n=1 Tax=Methanohalophilus halophilus TaxID=2177 RepID=A0A1H2U286_9EURY|nr:4Fe-4S dicluster domain-containing protein [Methanohalophilus halophilus]SDW49689.1 4Fe-4S binding domain-containing protein [Methanohalophilus halophilus]